MYGFSTLIVQVVLWFLLFFFFGVVGMGIGCKGWGGDRFAWVGCGVLSSSSWRVWLWYFFSCGVFDFFPPLSLLQARGSSLHGPNYVCTFARAYLEFAIETLLSWWWWRGHCKMELNICSCAVGVTVLSLETLADLYLLKLSVLSLQLWNIFLQLGVFCPRILSLAPLLWYPFVLLSCHTRYFGTNFSIHQHHCWCFSGNLVGRCTVVS